MGLVISSYKKSKFVNLKVDPRLGREGIRSMKLSQFFRKKA
ncbi:hypothetical protein LEP1GSC188_4683 [Leptospira weilii serovar Topaz str. LT2116]|uniref:Uncharacterized protein n=1 Tax=Leptospira weilii serovar Topaz str. LT2116 TaxID=1088540 RepID=M3EIT7_9LEPT|nr:hypothetical protein LEP1GSC188_4683 [Leptospira weilii serovar Topaz str. LT2116]